MQKCETGLTAISSKLGWLLNGPVIDKGTSRSVNVVNGHVMSVRNEINEEKTLANEVKKFWSLDMVGINENEASIYDKFNDTIKFKNGRYEVELPFKENHPILHDNYTICKSRLEKMRNKLNEELKRNYDVFKEQLEAGIIEKVHNERYEIGTITYLPHREVVRKDKSSTKVRVVFDARVKRNENASLNEVLYKGPYPELYKLLLKFRVHPN